MLSFPHERSTLPRCAWLYLHSTSGGTKLLSIREASPKGCESGCLGGWTASQKPRVGFLHPGFWLPDHGNRDLLRSGDIESNPGPLRGSGRGGQGHGGNPVAPVNSPRGGGRGRGGNPMALVNSLGSCSQCGGDFTRWSRPLSCAENCGRQTHRKVRCSGLRSLEAQRLGDWQCGVCTGAVGVGAGG